MRGWVALAVAAACSIAAPAAAQWSGYAGVGGVAHDVAGVQPDPGLMLGLSYVGERWFTASAGVPFDGALPWAAAGAGGRETFVLLDRFRLGGEWSGQGFLYLDRPTGDGGSGLLIRGVPTVSAAFGPIDVAAGFGGTSYLQYTVEGMGRRDFLEAVASAAYRSPRLSATTRVRRLVSPSAVHPHASVSVVSVVPVGTVHAGVERWFGPVPGLGWSAGLGIRTGRATTLELGYRKDPVDPIFVAPERTVWSVGIRHRVGGARPVGRSLEPETVDAGIVFRVPVSDSPARPSIAGDFTGWSRRAMSRAGDQWVITIPVEPGIHRYAFVDAEGRWFLPDHVENRVDDGFGGENAVLVVRPDGNG